MHTYLCVCVFSKHATAFRYDDLISRRRRQVERGSPPSNSRGPVGENKSASDKCVHKLSRSKRSKRLVSLWKSTRRRRQRSRCADACAICLATVRGRGVSLDSCHHTRFHVECLEKWLSIDSTCPLCRKSVSTINGRKVEPCERRDLSTEITREEVDWLDSLACELCGSGDDEVVVVVIFFKYNCKGESECERVIDLFCRYSFRRMF